MRLIYLILGFALSASASTAEFPGESLFHLKDQWIDAEGKPAQLSDLNGSVTAVAIVYTSCEYSCPLIVEELKQVRSKIAKKHLSKVKFALFSMDPERDTPAALKKYIEKRKLDPSFWLFYTAKDDEPVRTLSAVLGVSFKKVGKDFAHSNQITIIGPDGLVLFTKPKIGQQVEETAEAINKAAAKLGKK